MKEWQPDDKLKCCHFNQTRHVIKPHFICSEQFTIDLQTCAFPFLRLFVAQLSYKNDQRIFHPSLEWTGPSQVPQPTLHWQCHKISRIGPCESSRPERSENVEPIGGVRFWTGVIGCQRWRSPKKLARHRLGSQPNRADHVVQTVWLKYIFEIYRK